MLLTPDGQWARIRVMARKLRGQYSGAIYHVMNRGDRREPIFRADQDRQRFVETLVEPEEPLRSFSWSSWPEYLRAPSRRPAWLRVERLLGECGIPKDSAAGRRELELALERRRGGEEGDEFKVVRRGWCIGGEAFRRELLAQMSERIGAEHYGPERAETGTEKAERIINAELKRRGWKQEDLRERRKGDGAKVKIARRLRTETVQTVEWIAKRLHMGSRAYANHLLWRARKELSSQ